jgi:lysophospholipase L1-like esterase
MLRSVIATAAVALVLASAGARASSAPPWAGSWGAPPQASGSLLGPAAIDFRDVTLLQTVRLSAGGTRVRVRLSNEYGAAPLVVGGAHVAGGDRERALTFAGRAGVVIGPHAALLSDPAEIDAPTGSDLVISLYLPKAAACTCHGVALAAGWAIPHQALVIRGARPTGRPLAARAFITRVDVAGEAPAKAVVVLGDSLASGVGSTPGADQRWPDLLARRLNARDGPGRAWGVVNAAISGNRLNAGGAGDSALQRFDRDVLQVPGAAYVIVSEGVNDLGMAHRPFRFRWFRRSALDAMPRGPGRAADLIAAYRQLIARAHARGLKVIGATITPYEGSGYWSDAGEAERRAVNNWIRRSGAFDGVLDFDRAWRDPAHPSRISPGLHRGDHLHGDDAGYRVLADSIDLRLFQ